jgi:DNA-binding response OmpR family regulator
VRILLVEDDLSIAEPLVSGLVRHGFEVDHTMLGQPAVERAPSYSMLLLDLGLPDLDGTEVCRRVRARWPVPIIVLSARDEEIDRVMLLEIGADDYLVKPFGLRELVARINAVQRRFETAPSGGPGGPVPQASSVIEVGALRIDRRTEEVELDGRALALTRREFELLVSLSADPGAVCDREHITEEIWGSPHVSAKTLDVLVAALRRKLGDPAWVTAVRGRGFRLTEPAGPGADR